MSREKEEVFDWLLDQMKGSCEIKKDGSVAPIKWSMPIDVMYCEGNTPFEALKSEMEKQRKRDG